MTRDRECDALELGQRVANHLHAEHVSGRWARALEAGRVP